MDYQEAIERHIEECEHRIDVITDFMEEDKDSDKDKCTGCFGAANNDCPECIREGKSREKSNSEWVDMIMRRFMRRE